MIIGYNLPTWYERKIALKTTINLTTSPHLLFVGPSGSGKSFAIKYFLYNLKHEENIDVYFGDFKHSDEFRFLHPSSRFKSADDCLLLIDTFYKNYSLVRQGKAAQTKKQILILDEYAGLIYYLSAKDKLNKTRESERIKAMIAELLMLGRGTGSGFGIWLVVQRADASLFSGGSRDNFMTRIALGRLSNEQRQMLFSSEDMIVRLYHPGEGVCYRDGYGLTEIKIPKLKNINVLGPSNFGFYDVWRRQAFINPKVEVGV